MPNSVAEAQTPVEIGKTNILDQRRRIERQRGLIARLESDGSPDSVAEAVRILGEMEQALAQMEAHHAAAQEQPLEDSVDEPSLAKVMSPMSFGVWKRPSGMRLLNHAQVSSSVWP